MIPVRFGCFPCICGAHPACPARFLAEIPRGKKGALKKCSRTESLQLLQETSRNNKEADEKNLAISQKK